MDGGSTDGSVEIIKKYAPWLDFWESAPDRGQSDAVNKGLARATGGLGGTGSTATTRCFRVPCGH